MTDKDKSSESSDYASYDGSHHKQKDDAYASDIPAQDAAQDDAQVKGGIYKKYQQQIGEA